MKDKEITISRKNIKVIVFVILYIIIAAVVFWYVLRPEFQQLQDLNAQIWKEEEHLSLLQFAQTRIGAIRNDIDTFKQRISDLSIVLPDTPDEFLYGEEFLIIGKNNGVKITQLTFPKAEGKNVVFNISFEAPSLNNVRSFLDTLKNFQQITEVDILTINYGKDPKTGVSTYSVSIKGIIYHQGG